MTKKLEEFFEFDKLEPQGEEPEQTVEETRTAIAEIDSTIDKIDSALPAVRGLEASDQEMDEIAAKAQETFDDLMNLGMNIDSRYASEIFAVAGTMLGHALTAKTAKLNKKLKMVQLQLQKAKLDHDKTKNAKDADVEQIETAEGQVLSRNDLLERLLGDRNQNNKTS